MLNQLDFSPAAEDVKNQYIKFRRMGDNRAAAIAKTKNFFDKELEDDDDRFLVILGLIKALCQRKELTFAIADEMNHEIQSIYRNTVLSDSKLSYLKLIEQLLKDSSLYGDEATYKKRSPYIPNWEIGDTFCHTLTYPTAKSLGIHGWSIILYKVGEHIDEFEQHRQLMYVSLCAPGKEPSCSSDIQSLGLLRMMRFDAKSDYLAQIILKSRNDELSYGLTKIGRFSPILPPDDSTDANPLTARPLFGKIRKDDIWPSYEDHICRLYRRYAMP